ncbi:MAG: DNA-3-methyladenine glycosylase [Spirochaetia bacterium]
MAHSVETLPPAFYGRDSVTVAQDLLGTFIVRSIAAENDSPAAGLLLAQIVETEAYPPDDPASHAYRGLTERNRVMFGAPGHAYVYLIYGIHHCLNAVTEAEGTGGAVLIRAAAPLYGVERMWRARFPNAPALEVSAETGADAPVGAQEMGAATARVPAAAPFGAAEPPVDRRTAKQLAGGPGKLTQALSIRTNEDNGAPLFEGALQIARQVTIERNGEVLPFASPAALDIVCDERVGISRAAEKRRRFTVAASTALSREPDPAIPPFRHRRQ